MKRLILVLTLLAIVTQSFAIVTAGPQVALQMQPADYYTFGFTFLMGLLGGYLLWGLLGSLASVIAVYILTNDKKRRRLAWYGCLIGCAIGITLKIIVLS